MRRMNEVKDIKGMVIYPNSTKNRWEQEGVSPMTPHGSAEALNICP